MKILIASDSYKHCLSSKEVGEYLREGILEKMPEATVVIVPVADGGEGTVDSLVDSAGGKKVSASVHGPLMKETTAQFGFIDDARTAVMEMSAASGIELLKGEELDPFKTTTYGTGEMILKALDKGCRKIVIGLGGSATNDGGGGMLQALGVKLLDKDGKSIPKGGGGLSALDKIDASGLDERLKDVEIVLASDVDNPLTGNDGATKVYGPQKGAGDREVEVLEENIIRFADLTENITGKDLRDEPGAGAAGGIGFGFMAYLDAQMRNGFQLICEMTGLENEVRNCDLVITGEGKIDRQTQYGKTPYGVAQVAKKYNKPVIAVSGTLGEGYEVLFQKGFDALFSITNRPMSLQDSMKNAGKLLKSTGKSLAGLIQVLEK